MVFADLKGHEMIRYCVHPNHWAILFKLLSDLDDIARMAGDVTCFGEIGQFVKFGKNGDSKQVSPTVVEKLFETLRVIRNRLSDLNVTTVIAELTKGVENGIDGLTHAGLRTDLLKVMPVCLRYMSVWEFWNGLLAVYMYNNPYSKQAFYGQSGRLICSEAYLFWIVAQAFGHKWGHEENCFYKELQEDLLGILGDVCGDLERGVDAGNGLTAANRGMLAAFFGDLKKLKFNVVYGEGMLNSIKFPEEVIKSKGDYQDFKDAISNPYFHRLNKEVVVPIRNEVYSVFCDIGKQNGVEPEIIMARCLTSYAKRLMEHDK